MAIAQTSNGRVDAETQDMIKTENNLTPQSSQEAPPVNSSLISFGFDNPLHTKAETLGSVNRQHAITINHQISPQPIGVALSDLLTSSLQLVDYDWGDVYPPLKWVGGKRELLPELRKLVPPQFDGYHEPFLGGGAMFLDLASRKMISNAYLSDTHQFLMKMYTVVRDDHEELIQVLNEHKVKYYENPEEYFYRLKGSPKEGYIDPFDPIPLPNDDVGIAARFIVLAKTCWKGVYRVNKSGDWKLNVDWGEYKRPKFCDSDNLRKLSSLLRHFNPEIRLDYYKDDYKELLSKAKAKHFIYLDPPYAPVPGKTSFTEYTPRRFWS